MRYIGIIILLVLCLTLLLFTGRMINKVKPEPASGNLENQEDINRSSNNSQNSSTGPVEEPVIEEDTGETVTVYPQQWATGDGTVENPWANDCIKKALDFVPAGGTVYLRAGYYTLAAQLTISKQLNIIGEGRNKTIIKTATGTVDGFYIEVSYVSIKNLTVDGDAQTDGGGGAYPSAIRIANCDYVVLEDIEVKNAGLYGMDIFQVNHSSFQNIYAHDNYRHGMHPGSNTAGRNRYNTYRDIYCWDNGIDGFDDRGGGGTSTPSYNTYDNLHCWDNGELGIAIGAQTGMVLSNSISNGNGREGIYLYYLKDSNIHDCIVYNNQEGIRLIWTKNINLTNVIVKNSTANYGIRIDDSTEIKLTSCQSYDDRATPVQRYGLALTGTTTAISLLNCELTPNKNAAIYNPAGAVVKIITEKKKVVQVLAALSVVIVLCIFLVFSKICR